MTLTYEELELLLTNKPLFIKVLSHLKTDDTAYPSTD